MFCNRAEMLSMYETDDFDAALAEAAAEVAVVACTDSGERRVCSVGGGETWHVPAIPTDLVDATGAGDSVCRRVFMGVDAWVCVAKIVVTLAISQQLR